MIAPAQRARARARLQNPCKAQLYLRSFLFDYPIRVSLSGYVDDLATTTLALTAQMEYLMKTDQDKAIAEEIGKVGIAMH